MSTLVGRGLVRPLIQELHAYVPGEQPRIPGLIKLNTNENPYPPSPKVLKRIRAAVDGRLRLYPNPTAQALREKLARHHDCSPENILIGNGSDELLALAVRCFVEPAPHRPNQVNRSGPRSSASTVQFFTPSYSLYPVLAAIHGARSNAVGLSSDFALPDLETIRHSKAWDFSAGLTLITTPNAPSGRAFATVALRKLCQLHRGVVLLDEAYVDFADEHALPLALQMPHVLVARTFSKAYSLCFQRIGYLVGHPQLIAALDKIRDSYNVNGLGQIAALATLENLSYYRTNFRKVRATRAKLTGQLTDLGFEVLPSQANFLLVRPPGVAAEVWLEELRLRKILVRWFSSPQLRSYLRITVGTDAEAAALIRAVRDILN